MTTKKNLREAVHELRRLTGEQHFVIDFQRLYARLMVGNHTISPRYSKVALEAWIHGYTTAWRARNEIASDRTGPSPNRGFGPTMAKR